MIKLNDYNPYYWFTVSIRDKTQSLSIYTCKVLANNASQAKKIAKGRFLKEYKDIFCLRNTITVILLKEKIF